MISIIFRIKGLCHHKLIVGDNTISVIISVYDVYLCVRQKEISVYSKDSAIAGKHY